MWKKSLVGGMTLLLSFSSLKARTWTSEDGANTFKGDYISHNEDYVSIRKSGKVYKVKYELLSAADREWVLAKGLTREQMAVASELKKQVIGKKLAPKLVICEGGEFKPFMLNKAPEYYLLYFSASW